MTKNNCILAAFTEIEQYVRTPTAVKAGIVPVPESDKARL